MNKKQIIDIIERTVATFGQAFLALLIADASGVSQTNALEVAAVAGGLAAAKYIVVQLNAYLAASK